MFSGFELLVKEGHFCFKGMQIHDNFLSVGRNMKDILQRIGNLHPRACMPYTHSLYNHYMFYLCRPTNGREDNFDCMIIMSYFTTSNEEN